TVTFAGTPSVANVFVRITGAVAHLNGTVECTIPQANLFLMDSAGVVWGSDAKLSVSGSFAMTTANSLALGSGGTFSGSHSSVGTLTSAPLSAFDFTSDPNPLLFLAGKLQVPDRTVLSVVGGDVVSLAGLNAHGGRVNLASSRSEGTLTLDP